MRLPRHLAMLPACALLAACNSGPSDEQDDAPSDEASESPAPEATETVSILRPDIDAGDVSAPALEPLAVTIAFGDRGAELDAAAIEALEALLASDQATGGGTMVIAGHSDSGGSDSANLRASLARAEAVRDWMVDNGVSEDRLRVIAFGEQNPTEPNALPDGTPNEEGRALNRRVEVLVTPPAPETADED